MMIAARLTNNDRCTFPVTNSGDYCEDAVAGAYGIKDQCVGSIEIPLGPQGNHLQPICVVDSNDSGTMNAGDLPNVANTAATRPRLNLQPRDSDGDGDGNLCDADLDNTGFVDFPDLTLFQTAFFTADPDADFNGDAFVDFRDLTIFDFSFFQAPGPSCVDLPGGCTPLMCKESWNLVGVFYKNDWCLFVQFSLSHYPKSSFNFWR